MEANCTNGREQGAPLVTETETTNTYAGHFKRQAVLYGKGAVPALTVLSGAALAP